MLQKVLGVAFRKSGQINDKTERGSGTIYERMDRARKQRAKVLDTPNPANLDHKAPLVNNRPFPRLKPPRPHVPEVAEPGRMEWMIPIALALIILAILIGFAVR
jgi:hypothetical protein